MKSKIISIGDEILIGQVVNTNASYLGDKLFAAGIPSEKITVIGDEEEIFMKELDDSVKNYDLTIITGGLGPTHDDITKTVLIKYFNDTLVTDEKVLEHVKNFFAKRNIKMPEANIGQALVPKNSEVIWNHNGTAPGIRIEKNGKLIIALPGVPYEMKAMIEDKILPDLEEYLKNKNRKVFLQKTLLTTGLGESTLNERLGNIYEIIRDSKLAFLPSAEGVRLRINVTAETSAEAEIKLNDIESAIRKKAGDFIYGINNDTLERVTGQLLRDKKNSLSVAESCTGGEISSRIVSVAGSSDYYTGGVCSYSNEQKRNLLGVKSETLERYGAVSEETAIEMADGIRKLMKTDYSVSTTGVAGPSGGSELKPVGLVWIGFSSAEKSFAMRFNFGERRDNNIKRASIRALEILRREILKIEQNYY
jgi:nicotinamide-nucleotide amidase